MPRILIALVVAAVVAGIAAVIRSRRVADPPSQSDSWQVPAQIDRHDFARPEAPWLVVVFSSTTCAACASMVAKAKVLASSDVAVHEADYVRDRALHERYRIDAVPTTVIVDRAGVVRQSFLGPITATDLWAAVAGVRDPSTRVEGCQNHERPVGPD